MTSSRLEALQNMVDQNPSNSFALYGLAMEQVNLGQLATALDSFRRLLAAHPDYVAGYFHGGQTCEKLGNLDEARALYRKGIEAATRTGDRHSLSELHGALDLLGDESL